MTMPDNPDRTPRISRRTLGKLGWLAGGYLATQIGNRVVSPVLDSALDTFSSIATAVPRYLVDDYIRVAQASDRFQPIKDYVDQNGGVDTVFPAPLYETPETIHWLLQKDKLNGLASLAIPASPDKTNRSKFGNPYLRSMSSLELMAISESGDVQPVVASGRNTVAFEKVIPEVMTDHNFSYLNCLAAGIDEYTKDIKEKKGEYLVEESVVPLLLLGTVRDEGFNRPGARYLAPLLQDAGVQRNGTDKLVFTFGTQVPRMGHDLMIESPVIGKHLDSLHWWDDKPTIGSSKSLLEVASNAADRKLLRTALTDHLDRQSVLASSLMSDLGVASQGVLQGETNLLKEFKDQINDPSNFFVTADYSVLRSLAQKYILNCNAIKPLVIVG